MVSLCARFSNDERLGNAQAKMELSRRSREAVILNSMESFSVANLQALIICAFDTVRNQFATCD
jgi:DNA-directed RNA polymerase specialized sigma24 family protein